MKIGKIINYTFKDINEFKILQSKYNISVKEIEFLKFTNPSLNKLLNNKALSSLKGNKKLEYTFKDKLYYYMFLQKKYHYKKGIFGIVSLFTIMYLNYLKNNNKNFSKVYNKISSSKTSAKDKDLELLYYLKKYTIN